MDRPHDPGLLVVAIDRLPAWILPAYGATWVAMPRLTGLAARGIVFDRAITTHDDPAATLADLLGGAGDPAPLVAAAAARGWKTALVTDDAAADVAGADVTRVVATAKAVPERDAAATCLARLAAAACDVLAAGRHGLVVLHATSLGTCWDAPGEFRDAYVDAEDPPPPAGADVPDLEVAAGTDPDLLVGIRQAFAGQLTLLDSCLGEVLAAAGGRTVAVVGLRGLALGLHGRVGPGPLPPFGELVHVPAIVADAGGRMAGQRYGGLVTPADLGATLVAEVRGEAGDAPLDAAAPWRGRSLAGLLGSWTCPPRDRVVATGRAGVAVVTPGWHFVVAAGLGEGRLFAKPDDYFDLCDVADRCPEVAVELGRPAAVAAAGDLAAAWREPLSPAAVAAAG